MTKTFGPEPAVGGDASPTPATPSDSSVLTWIRSRVRPAWFGVLALGLITLLITSTQATLNVYILNSVLLAMLGAIALNVLMGTAGQPSIGNAAFLAVGGFVTMFLIYEEIAVFPWTVVIAALVSVVVGLVIGLPALRLQGLHLILATLAMHFIVIFFATRYQQNTVGASPFVTRPEFADLGRDGMQVRWAWLLFAIVAVVVLAASRLVRERSGRAWRLVRDHELIAPTLGIRPTRYKLVAFALSSGLIGVQGALLAHFTGSVTVEAFTLALAIQYLAMVLIGGLDSIPGAMIGAAIVVYIPNKMPDLVGIVIGTENAAVKGPQISLILYGILIIVFITSSPQGVIGWLRGSSSRTKTALRRTRDEAGSPVGRVTRSRVR